MSLPPSAAYVSPRNTVWRAKLIGKKLHDALTNETAFCIADLPEIHRVRELGFAYTCELRTDRLDIWVNKDGVVTHCVWG